MRLPPQLPHADMHEERPSAVEEARARAAAIFAPPPASEGRHGSERGAVGGSSAGDAGTVATPESSVLPESSLEDHSLESESLTAGGDELVASDDELAAGGSELVAGELSEEAPWPMSKPVSARTASMCLRRVSSSSSSSSSSALPSSSLPSSALTSSALPSSSLPAP